jgi:hypothetical protein
MGSFSFEASKETKMLVSKEASFAQAMPHKPEKTWAATFCPCFTRSCPGFCKNCYALQPHRPPLFSPLSAEASLLTFFT